MNTMTYKGYVARIDFDESDNVMVGRVAGIADVVSFHADSVPELRAAFEEAVDDYVATCAQIGKEPQRSYSGNLMIRVDPKVHASAAIAAEVAGKSLNQWLTELIEKELAPEHQLVTLEALTGQPQPKPERMFARRVWIRTKQKAAAPEIFDQRLAAKKAPSVSSVAARGLSTPKRPQPVMKRK